MNDRYQGPTAPNPEDLPELSEDDQQALEYYLSGGGRKEKRGYHGEERRSVGSVIDREIFVLLNMKMKSSKPGDADRMIDHFQDYAPITQQEGTTLMAGAAKRVESAARIQKGDPEKVVINRYYTYSGYLVDAHHDIAVLNQAVAESEDPDIDLLRNSSEIQEVITKELMARGFLWDKFYPNQNWDKYKERYSFWKGYTLAVLRFASEESIEHLYKFARRRADLRFREWMGQMKQIEAQPMVQKLENEGRIINITLSKLWTQNARQLEMQAEADTPVESEPEQETDFAALLPEEARRAIEQQQQTLEQEREEVDREMEKLQQRMTPEAARQELIARGYGRMLLGETMRDQEDEQELRDIAERAARPKQPKPKKIFKRRWRGESGPSDKRKESDYR
jgi:hypothetical protein